MYCSQIYILYNSVAHIYIILSINVSGQELEMNEDLSVTLSPVSEVGNQTCTCNEDFFCKRPNGSEQEFCVPECGTWEEYPHKTVVIIDAVVILAAIIGLVSGVAVLIITGIRRKKVYV